MDVVTYSYPNLTEKVKGAPGGKSISLSLTKQSVLNWNIWKLNDNYRTYIEMKFSILCRQFKSYILHFVSVIYYH